MFPNRKEEIHKLLGEAVQNMRGREISSKKDQEEIWAAVNLYFNQRQNALKEAIELLKSNRKSTAEQREGWNLHMSKKSTECIALLVESLKGKLNKPTLFTNVIGDMITQESAFFVELSKLLLPDTMKGKLLEYRKEFETEKKNLQEKWDRLLTENKSINNNINDAAQQLIAAYKTGFNNLASSQANVNEQMKMMINTIRLAAGIDVSAPNLMTPIASMVETLKGFMITSKDLAYRFEQLYRSEETVAVIMFGNTRKSVKEFLEKTNLDKAQKDYDEAVRHAEQTANNMLTNGQKADAFVFVKAGIEATKRTLTEFTDEYNSFVNTFKEIFIGPVGDRTVNDLINKERWDLLRNEFRTFNIQTELKKIYDDNREWINVDLFEMTYEMKKLIDDTVKKEFERLNLALKQADDPGVFDAVKMFITIAKDNCFSKIKNF
jgi:hypothetical protein